jgi:ABC-type oligopeptide transport system substrate-binding subunit
MKKSIIAITFTAAALMFLGCGPSAEEQEKQKQEIIQIETANNSVDSTMNEVKKSSEELDDLLNQLDAQ